MSDLECQLSAERSRRLSDAEEWRQFQADLLMTVRVANDFQVKKEITIKNQAQDKFMLFCCVSVLAKMFFVRDALDGGAV